jgi:hypothetical protein
MSHRLLSRVAAGALFLILAWFAYTQNTGGAPQLKINKVHDDLYEIEGDGGNVAVLVTNEGIILVDDKFDADHDAILAQIKTVSKQRLNTSSIRTIIRTTAAATGNFCRRLK